MKAQRPPPNYIITKDDGEMISRMVQDYLAEDKLHKELIEMGQLLKKFGES
jgi:hypothetical protein